MWTRGFKGEANSCFIGGECCRATRAGNIIGGGANSRVSDRAQVFSQHAL